MQPAGNVSAFPHDLKHLIQRIEATAKAPGLKNYPALREDLNEATRFLWQYLAMKLADRSWHEPARKDRIETEKAAIQAWNNSRRRP